MADDQELVAELAAIEAWAGERIVQPGDDARAALAPGTAFSNAYVAARAEIAAGSRSPSPAWRRDYALLLGLQRILSDDKPHLTDGLELREHQVDALAGMLAALLGDAQRGWEDQSAATEDTPSTPDDPIDDASIEAEARATAEAEARLADAIAELGLEEEEGSEPDVEADLDGVEEAAGADDEDDPGLEPEPIHDPGAVRRYRFKHPTASGKTVAAAGFVEAARITGVLILTHRRLLVDQFHRDLREHGYGHRLKEAILVGKRVPAIAPVTVETYAWFIRNAHLLNRDVYGVVLCDEAHTALGEKTALAIRALDTPTYIGMTATDELLQKHVGDVFPAEIADFPLAEAVKRGVVAPLRAIRVRPGASVKRVRIVGGDFDQQELALALDHDALNMAAAMYYSDMFGHRPGIVYSAGVDHAVRVAAAMRAVGLKAAAVSGRTPPRELANTLAAYERGEINVLVNAQLLAEGWNAPRATVCMHLAPTASKRVYQQRIGRIMRLHRRKEAGVVVDFAEATAPHNDRTVTVHSLLGVETYHPGALVTPRSPRRRQRWRRLAKPLLREAGWLVPVTNDPEARREIILRDWKHVAIDRLPDDEQDMWAENAGRKVGQKDLPRLAKVLSGIRIETRMLFFATCAAENKNRALRLIALGDLAQNRPTANVFERAVRLVEAAPTWRLDRAQGSRTLLLAIGDHRVEASEHQYVAWAWRLARASRDAQFRKLATTDAGRDLARSLAGKTGDELFRQAKRIAASALASPLDLGVALLAVVQTSDPTAARIIEEVRVRLSVDGPALAAALGTNVPLPRAPRRPAGPPPRRAPTRKVVAAPSATPRSDVDRSVDEEDDAAAVEDGESPSRRKRKRRRRRRAGAGESVEDGSANEDALPGSEVTGATPSLDADGPSTGASPSPTRRRRRRRGAATASDPTAIGEAAEPATTAVPQLDPAPAAPVKPARARRRTVVVATPEAPLPEPEEVVSPEAAEPPKRPRRRKAVPPAAE